MNPILAQQMATYRMADLHREAAAARLVAIAKSGATGNFPALRKRLNLSAGRLRLVLRGSAA